MLFEKEEKRFTVDDINLSPETLDELKDDINPEEAEVDDLRYDASDEDGSYEIGEDIKREDAGLEPIDKDKPKPEEEFNEDGFNKLGFNKEGLDKDGKPQFDEKGFDKDGFDKDGKTADGREAKDFTDGFDKDGFNALGFNADGKDKDGNTAPSEEISKEETSSTEDALVFSDIVDGKKEVSIKTEDGSLNLKDVLDVFKNQKDWNAKNTQTAQANARTKEEIEATQQEYEKQNLEFKDTLETVVKDVKFLEETDEYFGGENKNPIRKLFETVNANQESVANRTKADEERRAQIERDSQKRADEELAQIIAQDESYNSLTKVQELYKVAEDNQVGLMTAFELQQTPILKEKLSTIEQKHKEVTDGQTKEINHLKEELKKRNEKIQMLEKNPKLIEPDDDIENATGSDEEVGSNNFDSFDAVEKHYQKKMGIKT